MATPFHCCKFVTLPFADATKVGGSRKL